MDRSKAGRPYYNHQTWREGRNVTEYVPAGKVDALNAAIENYGRFMKLVEEYVDIAEARAAEE